MKDSACITSQCILGREVAVQVDPDLSKEVSKYRMIQPNSLLARKKGSLTHPLPFPWALLLSPVKQTKYSEMAK